MQYLRDLSKTKLAAILTGAFAIAMVSTGLQGIFLFKNEWQSAQGPVTQEVFSYLVHEHKNKYGSNPDQKIQEQYLQDALQQQRMYDNFGTFFIKHQFTSSTKHTIRLLKKDDHFSKLLNALDSSTNNYTVAAAEKIKNISQILQQKVFMDTLSKSTIIPEKNREAMRKIFMQQRTYMWLELKTEQVANQITEMNNAAEIQEYYEKQSFHTPASAVISTITIYPEAYHDITLNVTNTRKSQDRNLAVQLQAVQEAKLYYPKDINKISEQSGLSQNLKKGITLTENSKNTIIDDTLTKEIFSTAVQNDAYRVSNPHKQADGSYIIYQIQNLMVPGKKPLEEVRMEIIKQVHEQKLQQKLRENAELSLQQLRNGTDIALLERKFNIKANRTNPEQSLASQIPQLVSESAKHIASENTGWHNTVMTYNPTTASWFLLTLEKAIHTDRENTQEKNIISDETLTVLFRQRETNPIFKEIMTSKR